MIAAADAGVDENAAADIQVKVTDPKRAEGTGTVTAEVTSSLRRLPAVTDDYVDRADQGVAADFAWLVTTTLLAAHTSSPSARPSRSRVASGSPASSAGK